VNPVTRRRRWIDLLVAAFLIVLVPGCWAWALLENGAFSSSDDPDAQDEDGEDGEDGDPRELQGEAQGHTGARALEPPPAEVATAPRQRPVTHRASTLLASVAPKSHPLRLSVRRQQ